MPRTPCALYDITIRWRDPGSREFVDYDVLALSWVPLREVCDLFEGSDLEVLARGGDLRVVNCDRLLVECKRRALPVMTFTKLREVAEAEGVLDRPFHLVGFGPGLAWSHR
jgi:hypothetical protein